MRAIEFIDLVMLWCIMEHERECPSQPLSIRNMMLSANKFLAQNNIGAERATPIKSMDKAQRSLKKWLMLGFLSADPRLPTQHAYDFFHRYRGWREWPVEIPLMFGDEGLYLGFDSVHN